MVERLRLDRMETPVGTLAIVADERGALRAVGFEEDHARMEGELARRGGALERASDPSGLTSALRRYFDGALDAIDALPVAPDGTDFQRAVWAALREIPCGTTWSYEALARRVGNAAAVRAVGLANGANPIAIVIPCHRVIGKDGSLTGYGGGLARKRWLLEHERALATTLELDFGAAR